MREFFRGWRRKVGCVALVMALATCGLWMRSRAIEDSLVVEMSVTRHNVWLAGTGFWWVSSRRFNNKRPDDRLLLKWESRPAQPLPKQPGEFGFGHPSPGPYDASFQETRVDVHWRWRFLGGDFGSVTRQGGGPWGGTTPQRVWFVPFWWIVLPLTLLSAYLNLRKPRKRTGPDHA